MRRNNRNRLMLVDGVIAVTGLANPGIWSTSIFPAEILTFNGIAHFPAPSLVDGLKRLSNARDVRDSFTANGLTHI
jgi:hypothetical protein